MKDRKKICVFCSSNKDLGKIFIDEAWHFGNQIGKNNFDVIWGGCDMASMGSVARGVQAGGGAAIGIITQHFIDGGYAYKNANELIVAKDLRERKHLMQSRADAFAVLPGGFGTLDEFFDILAAQIINLKSGKQIQPIMVLNSGGFFNEIKAFFDKLYAHKVADEKYKALYTFVDKPEDGVAFIRGSFSK